MAEVGVTGSAPSERGAGLMPVGDPMEIILRQGEACAGWVKSLGVQLEHLEALFDSGTETAAAGLSAGDGALEEHLGLLREETLKSLVILRRAVAEASLHLDNKVDNVHQILGV